MKKDSRNFNPNTETTQDARTSHGTHPGYTPNAIGRVSYAAKPTSHYPKITTSPTDVHISTSPFSHNTYAWNQQARLVAFV